MSVLTVALVIILVGVLLYLVNAYIDMAAPIKKILNIVVVICLIIWLLQAFGVIHNIGNVHFN